MIKINIKKPKITKAFKEIFQLLLTIKYILINNGHLHFYNNAMQHVFELLYKVFISASDVKSRYIVYTRKGCN